LLALASQAKEAANIAARVIVRMLELDNLASEVATIL